MKTKTELKGENFILKCEYTTHTIEDIFFQRCAELIYEYYKL